MTLVATFRASRVFLSSPVPANESHHASTLGAGSLLIGQELRDRDPDNQPIKSDKGLLTELAEVRGTWILNRCHIRESGEEISVES